MLDLIAVFLRRRDTEHLVERHLEYPGDLEGHLQRG
jgi:hypothetical protein